MSMIVSEVSLRLSSVIDLPAAEAPLLDPVPVVIGSLSPSRAADFKTCPLLYRFRSIDRLPQKPSPAATRGTVVHAVLERLFDLEPGDRKLAAARDLVTPEWQRLLAEEPELDTLFAADSDELAGWLDSARDLVTTYFSMEDPTRFTPVGREQLVEATIESGLLLRGYVDRLDESPSGLVRVVDYKTGASPREAFEAKALFQMKFYALVLWRARGVIPAQLKLIYLADKDTLTYSPDAAELEALERQLGALWAAIERAVQTQDFRPSPSKLCAWCDFQALCPTYGGTPPPFPEHATLATTVDRRTENAAAD